MMRAAAWLSNDVTERELQDYQDAVKRVRKLQPGASIQSYSPTELRRLQELATRLERAAALRDLDDVAAVATGTLNSIITRHNDARKKIIDAQRLAGEDSELFAILALPADFWDTPTDIRLLQRQNSDVDKLAQLTAALELQATRMTATVDGWHRLTVEQQTRKLLLRLAARITKLEETANDSAQQPQQQRPVRRRGQR
jgi:hypothetical protein